MYTVKVTRFRDGNTAEARASTVQILMDHLKASTARHGFEMQPYDLHGRDGELLRNGVVVGEYLIYKER